MIFYPNSRLVIVFCTFTLRNRQRAAHSAARCYQVAGLLMDVIAKEFVALMAVVDYA